MSYPCSKRISYTEKGKHKYITYELDYPCKKDEFLKYILPVLKEEYGFGINFEEKINNANAERTKNLKKFMARFNTPDPQKQPPKDKAWLKNTRGKLPEVIAKDLLRNLENVKFTCRLSLEEEDPDMPRRGIDNFGFIFKELGDNISLDSIVTCEVKASDAEDSPPSVVHKSDDSMFKSLMSISNIDKRFQKALAKSMDKLSAGQYLELVCDLAEELQLNNSIEGIMAKVVVVPFLFRKKECWTEEDYGKFKTDCDNFKHATIKYYIMTIDYELNNFADEVYEELRVE